jgi:hypothetical protein
MISSELLIPNLVTLRPQNISKLPVRNENPATIPTNIKLVRFRVHIEAKR